MPDIAPTVTVIRASSLSGYADCPRRSAARMFAPEIAAAGYTLRETPRGIGAAVGTSVHRGAAMILDAKAKTGELPAVSDVNDAAIETLKAEIAPGILYDDQKRGPTRTAGDAEQHVLRMTAVYRTQVAPGIQPIIVEEKLEAQVTPSLALSGHADVIAREPGRVRDLKTGTKQGNHKPQIGAYSLLARSNGIDVTEGAVDFIRRGTLSKPQEFATVQQHNIADVENAARQVLRHIEGDLKTFREGDFARGLMPGDPWAFMANPSSILCSGKWCSAHGTDFCREHAAINQEE